MDIQKYIEQYIAPRLQGDGGWIEFVSLENNNLTVIFRGECSKCLILNRCIEWIEMQIHSDLKKDIKIIPIRKKPYFQDT